jgi:broad specificity phosphatase PhoE
VTTSTNPATGVRRPFESHPDGGETTLYLVRHGRTSGNVLKQLIGATDIPLDDIGLRQAERIADRLALGTQADVIVTSPLIRARATAEIIGRKLGLEPVIAPGLVEMNFGDLEGLTLDIVAERYPELAVRALNIDDHELAWPNGDSRVGFHERVLNTFLEILREYSRHSVIVVAHGGVLGSFLAQVEGNPPNNWQAYQLANCGLSHIDFRAQHTAVHFKNDCGHLETLIDVEGEKLAP